MSKFCLIGKSLAHSYSKIIHNEFGYDYSLVEIMPEKLHDFVQNNDFCGYNVTIPYKEAIISYLDELDESAKIAGSVNTVIKRDGKNIGFNTDVKGLKYLLDGANINLINKKILILGSGGTSKTAATLARMQKAKEIVIISRNGAENYQNIDKFYDFEVIINTTPVGMYPNNGHKIIEIDPFKSLEAVVDVIYNPLITEIMFSAKKLNVKAVSGLKMLVAQAKFARDLFLNIPANNAIIEQIYNKILKNTLNIVLIGMPSSGKSTIGSALAKSLDRSFVDIDFMIEKSENRTISDIFKENGEPYFRKIEREMCQKYLKENGLVISVGGGAPIQQDIYPVFKQNSVIAHLLRDLSFAETKGRPLLQNSDALKALYQKRMPIYCDFADITVKNNQNIEDTVKELTEKFYEYIGN